MFKKINTKDYASKIKIKKINAKAYISYLTYDSSINIYWRNKGMKKRMNRQTCPRITYLANASLYRIWFTELCSWIFKKKTFSERWHRTQAVSLAPTLIFTDTALCLGKTRSSTSRPATLALLLRHRVRRLWSVPSRVGRPVELALASDSPSSKVTFPPHCKRDPGTRYYEGCPC